MSKRVADNQMKRQRTLKRSVEIMGDGLHSGAAATVRILPAPADSGLVFVRTDLGGAEIPALHAYVRNSSLATTLARGGASVGTVEHLLAALHGLGVDNARIEVEGPEVPILDGSAAPFVAAIQDGELVVLPAARRAVVLRRPTSVKQGDRTVLAVPANEFRISYAIDFPHPAIGYQAVTLHVDEKVFASSIASARTFCMLKDVRTMQASGLALGGSLENALVVGDDGVLNGTLRFPDEFVRHKVLDLIGDLALVGAPLRAHVIVFKGGHQMHAALVKRIMARGSSWTREGAGRPLPEQLFEQFAHLSERLVPRPQILTA
jgi:UDP-3-O-[3-hydroxymyristoyl] N-acetylglucosamine deacetylase